MPTEKPRIMIVVDEDIALSIDHYRLLNGFKSTSKAALELILKGLSEYNKPEFKPAVFSGDEIKLIALFRKLTDDGRNEVLKAAAFAPKTPKRSFYTFPEDDSKYSSIDTRVLQCFIQAFPRLNPADQQAILMELLEKSKVIDIADDDLQNMLDAIEATKSDDLSSVDPTLDELEANAAAFSQRAAGQDDAAADG